MAITIGLGVVAWFVAVVRCRTLVEELGSFVAYFAPLSGMY